MAYGIRYQEFRSVNALSKDASFPKTTAGPEEGSPQRSQKHPPTYGVPGRRYSKGKPINVRC